MSQQHEEYQQRELPGLRRLANLPESATIQEVVSALIDQDNCAYATELLFATRRSGLITKDQIGWGFYLQFWMGRYPDELKEIAAHHRWSSSRPEGGREFAIEIYPGEWFIVEEPTATRVLTKLLGR